MKTIYKWELSITDTQKLEILGLISVLTVQEQHDKLCLWTLLDSEDPTPRTLTIRIIGTSRPAESIIGWKYLGSVQMVKGFLVWHIFYK